MIAHRLSTIRHATCIVVLHEVRLPVICCLCARGQVVSVLTLGILCCRQGEVVQIGDHSSLMQDEEGRYAKLVQSQHVHSKRA